MIRTELNVKHARANAKAMTKRLKELGVDVKHGQLLEALAAAYGHKSWHTMNEAIKNQAPLVKVVQEHLLMCQSVNPLGYSYAEIDWMLVKVSQELVNTLLNAKSVLEKNKDCGEYRVNNVWPEAYGQFQSNSILNAEDSTLVVCEDSFWFEIRVKHQNGHFEHEPIMFDTFFALAQKEGDAAVELAETTFGLSNCYYSLNTEHEEEDFSGYTGEFFVVPRDGDEDFQYSLAENDLIIPKD